MQIIDKKGLSGIVKSMLDLIFSGGIAITLGLPWLIRWYLGRLDYGTDEKYVFLLPFLYFTGILALLIVYELRRIFKRINRKDPFTMDNVKSLRVIAVSCFIICVAYIFKIVLFNSFLTIILMMVFIIAGMFMLVLAEVFRQAVMVKEENDLTI